MELFFYCLVMFGYLLIGLFLIKLISFVDYHLDKSAYNETIDDLHNNKYGAELLVLFFWPLVTIVLILFGITEVFDKVRRRVEQRKPVQRFFLWLVKVK